MAKRKKKVKKTTSWYAYGGNPMRMPKASQGLKLAGTIGDLNVAQALPFPFSLADPILDSMGSKYIFNENQKIREERNEARTKANQLEDELTTGGTKTSNIAGLTDNLMALQSKAETPFLDMPNLGMEMMDYMGSMAGQLGNVKSEIEGLGEGDEMSWMASWYNNKLPMLLGSEGGRRMYGGQGNEYEAEGGETIKSNTPPQTTGQMQSTGMPGLHELKGKSHSQGGEVVNGGGQEQYVFSKKLKSKIHNMSFADASKKLAKDMEKLKKILNDPSIDDIGKKTAQQMMKSKQKQLQDLEQEQEQARQIAFGDAMKGGATPEELMRDFPDLAQKYFAQQQQQGPQQGPPPPGMPLAAYGMRKYETGGDTKQAQPPNMEQIIQDLVTTYAGKDLNDWSLQQQLEDISRNYGDPYGKFVIQQITGGGNTVVSEAPVMTDELRDQYMQFDSTYRPRGVESDSWIDAEGNVVQGGNMLESIDLTADKVDPGALDTQAEEEEYDEFMNTPLEFGDVDLSRFNAVNEKRDPIEGKPSFNLMERGLMGNDLGAILSGETPVDDRTVGEGSKPPPLSQYQANSQWDIVADELGLPTNFGRKNDPNAGNLDVAAEEEEYDEFMSTPIEPFRGRIPRIKTGEGKRKVQSVIDWLNPNRTKEGGPKERWSAEGGQDPMFGPFPEGADLDARRQSYKDFFSTLKKPFSNLNIGPKIRVSDALDLYSKNEVLEEGDMASILNKNKARKLWQENKGPDFEGGAGETFEDWWDDARNIYKTDISDEDMAPVTQQELDQNNNTGNTGDGNGEDGEGGNKKNFLSNLFGEKGFLDRIGSTFGAENAANWYNFFKSREPIQREAPIRNKRTEQLLRTLEGNMYNDPTSALASNEQMLNTATNYLRDASGGSSSEYASNLAKLFGTKMGADQKTRALFEEMNKKGAASYADALFKIGESERQETARIRNIMNQRKGVQQGFEKSFFEGISNLAQKNKLTQNLQNMDALKLSGIQRMFPNYFGEDGAFDMDAFKGDLNIGGDDFNLSNLFDLFKTTK